MLNQESIAAVAAARDDDHIGRPLYDTFGFAQLPSLIRALLAERSTSMPPSVLDGRKAPQNLVVLLLDGFGWSFFERFAPEMKFLQRVEADGVVSKLTSQFPSTTSAHVTTLHTGQTVGHSGLFEWTYYEPAFEALFMPLPAATVGASGYDPVVPEPGTAYPSGTLYEALAADMVMSFCYQSERYAASTYSKAVIAGATPVPFRTLPEAVVLLSERIRAASGSSYHCVYFDVIDGISHRYGPDSMALAAEIRCFFRLLEDELVRGLAGTDTMVLLTADHGHIAVEPERTIYVDEVVPQLEGWMQTTPDGRALAPAGSPRDLFLYVEPERTDEAIDALEAKLEGRATVHRTSRLIEEGFFGPVQDRLRARLSPLVVLPKPGESVWWRGGGRFETDKRGHHGGLSRHELEIPLVCWRP